MMIDRINLVMNAYNLSATQFADEIGVQRPNMSHILSGRNNPSLEFVLKILNRFPELSTDWLLFGKGIMYKNQEPATLSELHKKEEARESTAISNSPMFDLFSDFSVSESEKPTEKQINAPIFEAPLPASTPQKEIQVEGIQHTIIQENTKTECPEIKIENSNEISEQKKEKRIVKFIVLYNDRTFAEYFPE